jgi:glycerol kinase
MTRYILALEQGTSSSRAIVYTDAGDVVSHAQEDFSTSFPEDGWVEQDPEVLWQTTLSSARNALADADLDADDVVGIGITNQRETTLVWDRHSGECVYPAIVWQDRRTADRCEIMSKERVTTETGESVSLAGYIPEVTGLVIDPYFSGTKLAWILDNVPGARSRAEAGDLCFGTVDSYLIWRLTQGQVHATDATNASRTQLFDIKSQIWNEVLLDYFGIPRSLLPEVRDNAAHFGVISERWLGASIPITGVAGDQQAALIGQACFAPGEVKSTYGTGCFVISNTGPVPIASSQNLLTTVAYRIRGQVTYGLEGSIFTAGVAIKWLRDQLGLIESAEETSLAYRATGGDSGGVFVVPAFTGLGAPHWQADARGLITGLTLDTSKDQIVTAFLQAVGYQTEELLRAMAADGAKVGQLRVDGGMVVNDEVCQFLADVLGVVVERPQDIETTARGAATLAAIGVGLYEDLASAATMWARERTFAPRITETQRLELIAAYGRAVQQALA